MQERRASIQGHLRSAAEAHQLTVNKSAHQISKQESASSAYETHGNPEPVILASLFLAC